MQRLEPDAISSSDLPIDADLGDADRQPLTEADQQALDDQSDASLKIPEGQDPEAIQQFAVAAARLIADSHCEEVLILDVRGLSQLTDFVVLGTGTSDRQIKGIGTHVEKLAGEHGLERLGVERDQDTRWLVQDYGQAMIHLFEPAMRAHYDLEMLWGDAPHVSWRRG